MARNESVILMDEIVILTNKIESGGDRVRSTFSGGADIHINTGRIDDDKIRNEFIAKIELLCRDYNNRGMPQLKDELKEKRRLLKEMLNSES